MFTGLVQEVGQIERVDSLRPGDPHAGVAVMIAAGDAILKDARPGDSICVNGVCLTATRVSEHHFAAEASLETLSRTVGLDRHGPVNLEASLRLGDKLGGHLVFGHVDSVADVVEFTPVGESQLLRVRVPSALARFLVVKGSVTVHGVSLTINEVVDRPDGAVIAINLIPHTLQSTTLRFLHPGARVNIEVDMIARYVERMVGHLAPTPSA